MKTIQITSPNVIRNRPFRQRLHSNPSSSEEVYAIVRQAIESASDSDLSENTVSLRPSVDCKEYDLDTIEVEVKAKLFLRDFSFKSAKRAIESACQEIGSNFIDSLQVAVPFKGLATLGINSHNSKESNADYQKNILDFISLWRDLETFIEIGTIGSLELCDIDANVLKDVYEKAKVKPVAITLNLSSCGAVPPEIQLFAQQNKLKLRTHCDAHNLLSDEKLDKMTTTALLGHLRMDWAIRYLLMDPCRDVLMDKRYIVGLTSSED